MVLPLQLGYARLFGDVLQLALDRLQFHLEAESVKLPIGHGGVAVRLRGVVRIRLIGRRRRWIPLDQPEKGMIVKTRRRSKMNQRREIDDHCLLRVLALLPSAASEARRRLRRRTILLWDVHCLERGRR
jgi:hypothetical protein